jgi:hypothetical protein
VRARVAPGGPGGESDRDSKGPARRVSRARTVPAAREPRGGVWTEGGRPARQGWGAVKSLGGKYTVG